MSHFLARNLFLPARPFSNVLQDGSEWRHTDAASNQNGDFVAIPVLMSLSIWSVQVNLQQEKIIYKIIGFYIGKNMVCKILQNFHLRQSMFLNTVRIVGIPQLVSPRSHSSDVQAQVVLMRCRGQSERMVFARGLHNRSNANPLSGFVVKTIRTLEFQMSNA